MKSKNMWGFWLRVALTFRLSLKNLCKFLGREETEEEALKLYNEFDSAFGENYSLKRAYDYLFNYETVNEPQKISDRSFKLASMFLLNYKMACQKKDKEDIKRIDAELDKLDTKYKKLKKVTYSSSVSEDEALIVSKYRVKYALSRESVCDELGFSYHSMRLREEKLKDEYWKFKVNSLSQYYTDVTLQKLRIK